MKENVYCKHTPHFVAASPFLETVFFPLVKQIRTRAAEVDDLGAAIAVFFERNAFLAIVCITNARTSANDASSLVASVVAFITNANQRARLHIAVTDDTFTVTFFAQATDCDAWLLAAHDKIGVVFSHCRRMIGSGVR